MRRPSFGPRFRIRTKRGAERDRAIAFPDIDCVGLGLILSCEASPRFLAAAEASNKVAWRAQPQCQLFDKLLQTLFGSSGLLG